MLITHTYLGSGRYTTTASGDDAHQSAALTIGANVLTGFELAQYSVTAGGQPLTTRQGNSLTVVTLSGAAGLLSVHAIEPDA
ncbi:hypothetical protein [Streptomyces decoyicus]|uniref:hypothetical protein n=1 Tax=Streptomyces decoyicus TaxID=249567 RepID=UPI0037F1FC96